MTLQAAYQAYQARQFDEANRLISDYIQRMPTDSMAFQLGALIASERRDYQTALQRIILSLNDPTNRHEKLNTQGNIYRAIGDDLRAEPCFESANKAKPDYIVARYNLARLLFETARPHQAAQQFAKIVQRDPAHELAWRGRVNALMKGQALNEAKVVLDKSSLSNAEKDYLGARLQFYHGNYGQALDKLAGRLTDPTLGGAAFSLTLQILYMTDRWAEAETLIDDILSDNPNQSDLWAAAIQALRQAGYMSAAETRLKSAPDGLSIDLVALDSLIQTARFEEAAELARKALQANPGHKAVMQRFCHAALGIGDYDLAQNIADFGLKAAPNNQSYYAIKATAGRAKGQNYHYYFDYEKFVRPFDLEPPAGWATIEAFNADLKKALDALHGFEKAPLDQTLRQGTQTAPDLRFVYDPVIQAFFKAVRPAVQDYLSVIGQDPAHPFLRRNFGGYHIRSAWSVRLHAGGHHVDHIHPEGWISSAYYVDVPSGKDKEGWIKFGEPPEPLNKILDQGPEYELQPRPGRLVLFPSYLWHGTYPITGDATRLTLPIDILPARPEN